MEIKLLSTSIRTTKKIASLLAQSILEKWTGKEFLVLALKGQLGSGKTTFTQGFLKAAGVKKRITSPSFVMMKRFSPKKNLQLFHFDLYRLRRKRSLKILNFGQIIRTPANISLIEWPEKIKSLLPKQTIWIEFKHGSRPNQRLIKIST